MDQLQAASSAADATMRSMKLHSVWQEEQILELQQAVLRCVVSTATWCQLQSMSPSLLQGHVQ